MNASIPTFRGQNFEFWKSKLTTFFRSHGLELALQQPAGIDKTWARDDAKARMYILESVDDRHVELIMQEATAKDMVNKLESMYSSYVDYGANNAQKGLQDNFLALKMADTDDPSHFFHKFETHVDMLDESGNRLSPREILNCLQMSVCKSYRHLFAEVDPHLEPLETVEVVKKRMLVEYAARTNSPKVAVNGNSKMEPPQERANPWNAFKEAFKDEPEECFRCGQSGHWARRCPQPKECYKCGQEGHVKSQCRHQQISCYGCGQAGHRKFECPDRPLHPALSVKHRSASMAAIHDSPPPRRRFNEQPVMAAVHANPPSHPRSNEQPSSMAAAHPPSRQRSNERAAAHVSPPSRRRSNERPASMAAAHASQPSRQKSNERPAAMAAAQVSPPSHRRFNERPASMAAAHPSQPPRQQSNERKDAESPPQHPPPLMTISVTPPAVNGELPSVQAVWVLDSCATYHTICDESLFSSCVALEKPIDVEVANGNTLSTSKVGEVRVCFRVGNRSTVKVLPNVYLMEEFEQNLLSIQRLVLFGGSVVLKSSEVELRDATNVLIAYGKKVENLYTIKSYTEKAATNGIDV